MKPRRIIQGIALLLIIFLSYFGYQMYRFSTGVVEDTKRLKELDQPKEFKLTDSTTMIIGKDSLLQKK